jgi:NhaP-type Na+/H+ or K+/H+ antiporter
MPAGLISGGGHRADERFPDLRWHCPSLGLAVACQVIAAKIRSPAIVLLLPVGFVAGALTTVINPDKLFGAAFPPLVSLAVAVVLFDGGLDLVTKELKGESRVVHRLRDLGIPMTWAGAGFFGWLLLGLSWKTAVTVCSARF